MNEEKAWEGVDKTVVAKVATEAGRPPRDPYINTDHGDLLLFLFLLAGAVAGFIGGYLFRGLFPPRTGAGDCPDVCDPAQRASTNGTVPFRPTNRA